MALLDDIKPLSTGDNTPKYWINCDEERNGKSETDSTPRSIPDIAIMEVIPYKLYVLNAILYVIGNVFGKIM